MAKALLGHLGTDPLLMAEVVSLRARVRALQAEVDALRAAVPVASSGPAGINLSSATTDLSDELALLGRATPVLA